MLSIASGVYTWMVWAGCETAFKLRTEKHFSRIFQKSTQQKRYFLCL